MVFARAGEVLDGFAKITAMQLRAAFAGGTDQRDGEARFESERGQRGFAVTRHALDANFLRVHGGIGFEIIQSARCAPGPRAQRAPVIRLAWLAFVDEADDSFRESRAVVGLNTVGIDCRVAPTSGDELFGGRRTDIGSASECAEAIRGRWFSGTSRKT